MGRRDNSYSPQPCIVPSILHVSKSSFYPRALHWSSGLGQLHSIYKESFKTFGAWINVCLCSLLSTDKLLVRLKLLSLKESLSHVPLPCLISPLSCCQNCKSNLPGDVVETPTVRSCDVQHKVIKKSVRHFPPVNLVQKLRPGPALPYSGELPSSCALWRDVPGRQLPRPVLGFE